MTRRKEHIHIQRYDIDRPPFLWFISQLSVSSLNKPESKRAKKSKQAKNSEQFWAIIIQGTQYLTQKHYMTTHILSPFKKRRGRPRIPPTRRFGLLQVEFQVWLCRVRYPFQHTWVFQSILKAINVPRPNFGTTSRNSLKCKVEKLEKCPMHVYSTALRQKWTSMGWGHFFIHSEKRITYCKTL